MCELYLSKVDFPKKKREKNKLQLEIDVLILLLASPHLH